LSETTRALLVFGPISLLAFAAGALRVLAHRHRDRRRRRVLQAIWLALLLAAVPLWLFAAATFGWL
jgi:membrane-anchored protein YejM (alkaline phosphatase superfamily)